MKNPKNLRRKQKQKVLMAMSGGVDSSVAALLLKRRGYEVIGVFMKNWSGTKNELGECSWKEDRREAMKIAAILKIPLITLDFEKSYKRDVVDEMFRLYKKGVTPNPDIDCNNKVKFPLLRKSAKNLGCDFIATGHYAQIKGNGKNGFKLLRAKDESKDQSYFLYRLSQKDLEKSIFPIGNLTKKKVRQIAKKNKFSNYNRKSTVGICFIGKVNLKEFLKKKIKPKKGDIVDFEGNIIGEHDGIYYYTIGQRLGPRFGLEIQKNPVEKDRMRKWYVAKKDRKRNLIIAAPENHPLLYRKEFFIKNSHWIIKTPEKNKILKFKARIRQVGELLPSKLSYDKKKKMFKIVLKKPITGVSEGQAVVLYKRKECMGGGVIGF